MNVQNKKLKEDEQQVRKTCCTWIRKKINNEKLRRMMFSDEKILTKNGYFNRKNDVIWADSLCVANEAGGYHKTEKFPVSVMVATCNGTYRNIFFLDERKVKWKNLS